MAKAIIGTSGWQYPDFEGRFYPENLKKSEQLSYYGKHFRSVEINNTFYQLPQEDTIQKWVDQTPRGFVFAVKASRYITHMKNLLDPEKTLPNFFDRIILFEEKCGPILFQLPPHWGVNPERLKDFLSQLPVEYRFAFEFRNPSWFADEIYDLLIQHGVSFCIYDFDYRKSPRITTTDFVYIRLHGPGKAYHDPYDEQSLQCWAHRIEDWLDEQKDVYCYFDNTYRGHAWENAQTLMRMLNYSIF